MTSSLYGFMFTIEAFIELNRSRQSESISRSFAGRFAERVKDGLQALKKQNLGKSVLRLGSGISENVRNFEEKKWTQT